MSMVEEFSIFMTLFGGRLLIQKAIHSPNHCFEKTHLAYFRLLEKCQPSP